MIAADNSRIESQRQLKFIVMLSKPQVAVAPDDTWRWKVFLLCFGAVIVILGVVVSSFQPSIVTDLVSFNCC